MMKKIYIYLILVGCIFVVLLKLYFCYEKIEYKIIGLSNISVTDRFCGKLGEDYYYVSDGRLYILKDDNDRLVHIIGSQVPIICTDENIYYYTDKLYKYQIFDNIVDELIGFYNNKIISDIQYYNLCKDGKNLFTFANYLEMKENQDNIYKKLVGSFNDNSNDVIFNDLKDLNNKSIIDILEEKDYKYFYGHFGNVNCVTGVVNNKNQIIYQAEAYAPLYSDNECGVFADEYEKGIFFYDYNKKMWNI